MGTTLVGMRNHPADLRPSVLLQDGHDVRHCPIKVQPRQQFRRRNHTGSEKEGGTVAGTVVKQRRGFASMDPAKHAEIARKGGRAAHAAGTAHQFTPEEAREAGRTGGARVFAKLGSEHMATIGRRGGLSISLNREHMSEIGRRGGEA